MVWLIRGMLPHALPLDQLSEAVLRDANDNDISVGWASEVDSRQFVYFRPIDKTDPDSVAAEAKVLAWGPEDIGVTIQGVTPCDAGGLEHYHIHIRLDRMERLLELNLRSGQ